MAGVLAKDMEDLGMAVTDHSQENAMSWCFATHFNKP
jgi:hypothetical protein